MSPDIDAVEGGRRRKKCPRGSHKSRSKKAGKKGHCVRSQKSPGGRTHRVYSSHRRQSMALKGGDDAAMVDAADLDGGKRRKKCPRGSHKSRSNKAGKKGHCVRSQKSPGGRTHRVYSSHRRRSIAFRGGEPEELAGGSVPAVEPAAAAVAVEQQPMEQPLSGGAWWFQADAEAAAAAPGGAETTAQVEGGRRRKKCPRGSHKSRSKKAGKKGHCVKSKRSPGGRTHRVYSSHRRSSMPMRR